MPIIRYHWKIKGRISSSSGITDYTADYWSDFDNTPNYEKQMDILLTKWNGDVNEYGAYGRVEEIYSCIFQGRKNLG